MPTVIKIELPRDRVVAEDAMDDDYLLNQMDKVNDSPNEDGLPLRKWIIREVAAALAKNKKLTEVTLKPKADKTSTNHYSVTLLDE